MNIRYITLEDPSILPRLDRNFNFISSVTRLPWFMVEAYKVAHDSVLPDNFATVQTTLFQTDENWQYPTDLVWEILPEHIRTGTGKNPSVFNMHKRYSLDWGVQDNYSPFDKLMNSINEDPDLLSQGPLHIFDADLRRGLRQRFQEEGANIETVALSYEQLAPIFEHQRHPPFRKEIGHMNRGDYKPWTFQL